MKITLTALVILLAAAPYVHGAALDEDFGYVDVRAGAHMFWVTYHTELAGDWTEHPLIMWLQGGPGASGVGYGNFKELGPYDTDGNLRPGRWTQKANLMFVDNPVGTGYSYVDDLDLLSQDNAQIASDLVELLKSVFTDYPDMQVMPFFVYAESYGGKMTADFAVALDAAIANGEITCNFQGIAMGDSWVSPMDSVNTWGSFLYSMGFVNKDGQAAIDAAAAATQSAVDAENWTAATVEWSTTESVVLFQTDGVDFYNVLVTDSDIYSEDVRADLSKKYSYMKPEIRNLFYRHVLSTQTREALDSFMNGAQADAWGIPDTVVWGSQSGNVFNHLASDFMKPVVTSVANLLANSSIHVSVYTGDLDLICDTPGTYLWIDNMDYPQKSDFEQTRRRALNVDTYPNNAAYVQRFERFSLFTILRSGHMVPIDVPQMALNMIDMITQYGAEAAGAVKAKEAHHKVKIFHPHSTLKEHAKDVKKVVEHKKEENTPKKQVKTVLEQREDEVKKFVEQKKQQDTPKEHVKKVVENKREDTPVKQEVKKIVQHKKEEAKAKEEVKKVVEHKKEEAKAKEEVKKVVEQKKEKAAATNVETIELDAEIGKMLKKKVFEQKHSTQMRKPQRMNKSPAQAKEKLADHAENAKVRELKSHVARSAHARMAHGRPGRPMAH